MRSVWSFTTMACVALLVTATRSDAEAPKKTPFSIDGTFQLLWVYDNDYTDANVIEEFHADGTFVERYLSLTSHGKYWMDAPDVIQFEGTTFMGGMKHKIQYPQQRGIIELYVILPQGIGPRSHVLKRL